MTRTRDEAIETAETVGVSKDDKENEDEYPENLVWVLCIWYPITFWKKSMPVLVLFNSDSEVNAIHPTFALKLRLFIKLMDIGI